MKIKTKLFILAALFISSVGFSQSYTGKKAAYLPDEDKTYLMENMYVSTDDDGDWRVDFINVSSVIDGDVTAEVLHDNPSYRPTFKTGKKRKRIDTPTEHVECVTGGSLCIILLSY